jgi:uncharacterized protein (TIGR02246 family)
MSDPGAEDRREIERLIAAYAHAVDARDVERIVDLFTAEAEIDYHGREPGAGTDAIRAFFSTALREGPGGRSGASTHLMSNTLLDLDGDRAQAQTEAVAFLAAEGGDSVTLRGLRYTDRFVRTGGGWRIAYRQHRCQWQCAAPGGLVPEPVVPPAAAGA